MKRRKRRAPLHFQGLPDGAGVKLRPSHSHTAVSVSRRRFGKDCITICDPNRESEGADKVFQRIYEQAI